MMAASLNKFLGKIEDGFYLNTGKCFLIEVLLKANRKTLCFSKKMLGFCKVALSLNDCHIFM